MKKVKKYQKSIEPDTLKKKIISYSTLAGSFLAVTPVVNAGIVYTDIDPDTTLNSDGQSYALDVNNDSLADFNLRLQSGTFTNSSGPVNYRWIFAALGTNNSVAASQTSYNSNVFVYPYDLPSGQMIDGNLNWNSASFQTLGSWRNYQGNTYVFGNFPGAGDRFIALKFQISGQTHYGWARVTVSSDVTSITIKDYAYEDTPNMPIAAGDTSSGTPTAISSNDIEKANIYSFGKTLHVNLKDKSLANAEMNVYNSMGQRVYAQRVIEPDFTVEIPKVSSAIYIVEIKLESGILKKEIFLN